MLEPAAMAGVTVASSKALPVLVGIQQVEIHTGIRIARIVEVLGTALIQAAGAVVQTER